MCCHALVRSTSRFDPLKHCETQPEQDRKMIRNKKTNENWMEPWESFADREVTWGADSGSYYCAQKKEIVWKMGFHHVEIFHCMCTTKWTMSDAPYLSDSSLVGSSGCCQCVCEPWPGTSQHMVVTVPFFAQFWHKFPLEFWQPGTPATGWAIAPRDCQWKTIKLPCKAPSFELEPCSCRIPMTPIISSGSFYCRVSPRQRVGKELSEGELTWLEVETSRVRHLWRSKACSHLQTWNL